MDALWWILLFAGSAWGIYTPGGGVKKPQVSAGIDTSTWTASTTPKDVVVYDRYSSVKMQQHSNAENLEGVYRDNRAGKYVSEASWNVQVTSERPLEQKHYFTVSSHGKQRWQNYYSGRAQDVGRDLVAYSTCPSGQTGQFVCDLSCNQYLNCYKGRGYRQNCAPGTLFNPKTLECDYADKVECISGPKKAHLKVDGGVSARQQQVSCPRGFSGIIPNYGDCSKFISCANGKENVMDCPPGTLFDVKSNMCDFPQKCDCVNGENEKQRAASQYVASYSSKSEAGRYAAGRYATGQHTTGQYPTGDYGASHSATGQYATGQHSTGGHETVYSATSRQYQYPSGHYHTGQSTENTYLAGKSSTTRQSGSTSGHTHTGYHGSHGVGQNYTRLERVILAPTQSAKCPSGYTGLHPHPYDCAKFLNCANGGTVVQDCGPGTHFSPTLKVCDFPYKVNCNANRGASQNYVEVASKNYDHKQQWSNGAEWQAHNRTGHSPQWHGENCSHGWHNHENERTNQQSNSNSFTGNGYNHWHQHTGNQWPQRNFTTGESYEWHHEVPRTNSTSEQNYHNSDWHQWHQEVPRRNSTNKYHSSDWHQWHQEVPQRNSTSDKNYHRSDWHQEAPRRNLTSGQNYHSSDWHQWHQEVPQENSTSDQNYHSSDWNQWHQPPNNPEQPTAAQGNPTAGQHYHGSNWHQTTSATNTSGPHQWHRPSTNQWRPTFPRRNSTTDHNHHSFDWNQPVHNHTSQWHKHHYVPPKSYTPDQKQYIPPLPPPPTPVDEDAQTFDPQQTIDTYDQATTRPKWSRPDVGRDLSTASTTNKHWPPPFPSTDLNADYVFEYDDMDVSLEADSNKVNGGSKKVIDWCDAKGFECGNKICISPSQVCDQTRDCPNGKDEERCGSAIWEFAITSGSKLAVREIDKILNITLPWCAKLCYEDKSNNCKSFNYRKMDGACFLLSTNVGHSGVLMRLPNYDYYEHKKFSVDCSQGYLCSSMKCLSRAQICDGVNDCGDGTDEKGCRAEAFGYSIALGGTGKKHVGRIEIQAFGKFGYVCDDMFGLRNADVVCRELGFSLGALEVKGNSFYALDVRENDTFYMMDDVICLGNETSLRDCSFSGWGVHNCQPQEIVGVVCKTPLEVCPQGHWKCRSGKECLPLAFVCDGVYDCTDKTDENPDLCESPLEFRLVNGTSKKDGRVEVRYHGIWGTICDDDFNDDAAKVVCSHFGYHGPAKVKKDAHFGAGSGPIWLDQVYCKGNETTVGECEHWHWGEHNCEHSEDVGVVCVDSQAPGSPRHSSNSLDSEESTEDEYDATLPKECGLRSDAIFRENSDVHFRVVQGSLAKRGEYPWQASIRIQGKTKQSHWCGAIVISQKYVLTAAHCLGGYSKGAYFITAGDYDIDVDEGTEQNAYIEDFIIHQQYRMGNKMNNDIAVVKLKGKGFKFTKAVQPICIPEVDLLIERNTNCTISGFGSIESGKSKTSHTLRAGWIPIQPVEVCKMPHVYGTAITDGMLCAGSLDEGIDACDGDSGGPLACLHEGLFTLFGITSWGQHCGLANRPGVYVKVSHYRQWIEETMQKLAEK